MGINTSGHSREAWATGIRDIVSFLQKHDAGRYTQAAIVRKLVLIKHGISKGLLNRIVKGGGASLPFLQKAGRGLRTILRLELGFDYDFETYAFSDKRAEGWQKSLIDADEERSPSSLVFHTDGRRNTAEKVAFFGKAEEEVIFVGLRMRQFINYFNGMRDGEFAIHVEGLLRRGVNVRCYLPDPDSNYTRLFFNDLAQVDPESKHGEESVRLSLQKLLEIAARYSGNAYRGQFSVHQYRHLPSAHYLIVDGAGPNGRMHVAHYLYGEANGKVPVLEVHRRDPSGVYEQHWRVVKRLLGNDEK